MFHSIQNHIRSDDIELQFLCFYFCFFFFFKQKTAYEMRISDWSSDVCSSDLVVQRLRTGSGHEIIGAEPILAQDNRVGGDRADMLDEAREMKRDRKSVV